MLYHQVSIFSFHGCNYYLQCPVDLVKGPLWPGFSGLGNEWKVNKSGQQSLDIMEWSWGGGHGGGLRWEKLDKAWGSRRVNLSGLDRLKHRGTRDQIANILWIIEKAREFQKNIYFCFIDYAKAFDYVDHNKLWKILQEMGIPDHLACLLRNLDAGQEETVRTGYGTTDWFQIGKGIHQGCILSPCLFNLYADYIMRNLGWKKHKLDSRLPGETAITSDMQMTPPLWQKVKRN